MGNNHSQDTSDISTQAHPVSLLQRRSISDPEIDLTQISFLRRTSSDAGYHPRSASLRRIRSIQRRRFIEGSRTTPRPKKTRPSRIEAESKEFQEKQHLLAACARGDISKVEKLVDDGVDVNSADKDHMTALHYASMHARDEVIQSLISRGAEVNSQDLKGGFTAMHWVVINAEPQYGSINHQEKSLVTLFRAGAKVDATDFNLATPLHTAAQKGNRGAVQALMKLGANPNALDITGRNCFEVAKSDKVVVLLRKLDNNSKKTPIYQVLEAPPPSFPAPLPPAITAPLPPAIPAPLPPAIPPPRLVTATKVNSEEHIYSTPKFSERAASVSPPLPPPRRRSQYVEYGKDNHIYHILEAPSTSSTRRKAHKQL